jgi:hypothetical protein
MTVIAEGLEPMGYKEMSSILAVPEIIDLIFGKTIPKRSYSMTENERFGLVFANTGSINSGTGQWAPLYMSPNAGGGGLLRGLSQ